MNFPNFWWVCQGKSYIEEKGLKYLRAPKRMESGATPYFWRNMEKVNKNDIIFNYANGFVQAVSIARNNGYDYFEENDKEWAKNSTRVDMDHYPIDKINISRLKARMDSIKAVFGEIQGPFDVNGDVKQGYLFEFTFDAAKIVREIYGKPFPEPIEKYFNISETAERPDNRITSLLRSKKQIILYGPPGTGKTYDTKKIALDIIESE